MGEIQSLAPLPKQTLAGWHGFVATGNADLLRPLLAEHVVFRSPFVQSPISGRTAALLVLTTVVRIFENFRYHREFVAGSHDVALEFGANIGKWQLKGIDLIKFDESGEMIEFEVMIRPIKALQALGDEMGNRIGPELARLKEVAAVAPILTPLERPCRVIPRLHGLWPCGKDRPAATRAFCGRFLYPAHAAVAQW